MAKYTTNSLGYKLSFEGPGTVEEYNEKAGPPRESGLPAVLEDAVENEIYRGTLPEWQDLFAPKIKEITGVDRAVNEKATEKAKAASKKPTEVKPVMETVKTYHSRALALATEDQKKELLAAAQACADQVLINPAPSERKGGVVGVTKDALAEAERRLEGNISELESKITQWRDELSKDGVDRADVDRDEEGKPKARSLAILMTDVLKARKALQSL